MKRTTKTFCIASTASALVLTMLTISALYVLLGAANRAYTDLAEVVYANALDLPRDEFMDGTIGSCFCSLASVKLNDEDNVSYPMYEFDALESKDELRNLSANTNDKSYYKKFLRAFVKDYRKVAECRTFHSDIQRQKILPKQTLLVRIASKIFRNFTICRIDRMIDFILQDVPDNTKQFNLFIMHYDESDRFRLFKILVDSEKESLELAKTMRLELDEHEAFVVCSDMIVKLIASHKQRGNER